MLVVLAIIVILTAIVFSGQNQFNRTLALNNAAYDVALSARQAQSFGLSSQSYTGVNNPGYGVYFDSATPSSYIFFADIYPAVAANALPSTHPGDGYYDSSTELVQTYSLNNGFSFSSFCVYSSVIGKICTGAGGLTALSISYVRPNTTTTIMGKTTVWLASTITDACVVLSSPSGDTRYIGFSRTGQVQAGTSTVNPACP